MLVISVKHWFCLCVRHRLAILTLFVLISAANVQADEPILNDVFIGDISNIAIGGFNLEENRYLFSIPKDIPPTDRGLIWGTMDVVVDRGKKYPFVVIFDCGPLTSHLGPYTIDFSNDDKYLVIESGGEGGSVIDVFEVSDLFEPTQRGWKGTDECVEPIATVGGYNVPVGFNGWREHMPLIESRVPLNEVSTSKEVFEYEKAEMCCSGEPQIFAWDIFADQFTVVEAP